MSAPGPRSFVAAAIGARCFASLTATGDEAAEQSDGVLQLPGGATVRILPCDAGWVLEVSLTDALGKERVARREFAGGGALEATTFA